jgi:hypothetical protein
MRPIPDEAEPVPRSLGSSAALAPADTVASPDAGTRALAASHDSRPPPCADSRGRPLDVRQIAPDHWVVARGVIDVIRSERKVVLARQVSASGALVGLAIRDIGKDSCLGFVGFEDGDLLRSINGRPAGDGGFISSEIYASIVKNGAAVVRFDRGGRPSTVVYEVQGE